MCKSVRSSLTSVAPRQLLHKGSAFEVIVTTTGQDKCVYSALKPE
jgi:hypothetical protein